MNKPLLAGAAVIALAGGMTVGYVSTLHSCYSVNGLPDSSLQKVQIQLTEIEANIADNKILYQQALAEHQALNARVDILETQIKPLLK